jgi:hypothetical protein
MKLTTHLELTSRLWTSGAMPSHPHRSLGVAGKVITLCLVEGWTPFTQHYIYIIIPVHLFQWYFTVRVIETSQIVSLYVERWQDMLFLFTDFKHEIQFWLGRPMLGVTHLIGSMERLNSLLKNYTSKMASDVNSNSQFFIRYMHSKCKSYPRSECLQSSVDWDLFS